METTRGRLTIQYGAAGRSLYVEQAVLFVVRSVALSLARLRNGKEMRGALPARCPCTVYPRCHVF
jgi:hypothetical protein